LDRRFFPMWAMAEEMNTFVNGIIA